MQDQGFRGEGWVMLSRSGHVVQRVELGRVGGAPEP